MKTELEIAKEYWEESKDHEYREPRNSELLATMETHAQCLQRINERVTLHENHEERLLKTDIITTLDFYREKGVIE